MEMCVEESTEGVLELRLGFILDVAPAVDSDVGLGLLGTSEGQRVAIADLDDF